MKRIIRKILKSDEKKRSIKGKIQNKRALTIAEAAEYACVSRGTIKNWIALGVLSFEDLPGSGKGNRRFILIRKKDLDTFLNSNYICSAAMCIEGSLTWQK